MRHLILCIVIPLSFIEVVICVSCELGFCLQVKVLYVRNLKSDVTDDQLREKFEAFGKVERVKKVKDYGFVHFESRENAMKAMEELDATVSIYWPSI